MEKGQRKLRSNRLEQISLKKYVPDEGLLDPCARLFRQLLNKLDMNPTKWNAYLRNYLSWVVTTEDPEKAKIERTTRQGNIKETFFQKPTLTFPKLLEGLSILRARTCKITIEVTDENGEVITVSETIRIVTESRLSKKVDTPPSES